VLRRAPRRNSLWLKLNLNLTETLLERSPRSARRDARAPGEKITFLAKEPFSTTDSHYSLLSKNHQCQ